MKNSGEYSRREKRKNEQQEMPMMNGVFCCLFCMVDAGQRIVRLIGAGWWQGYFCLGRREGSAGCSRQMEISVLYYE